MTDMKTENGLTITKVPLDDGRFGVALEKPDGEHFGEATFDEVRDQWEWKGAYNSHLTYVIGWADEAFVKYEEARSAFEERHWQPVVERYGDKGND